MKIQAILVLFFLLLSMGSVNIGDVSGHKGGTTISYVAITKPVIDGKWTTQDEWNDTMAMPMDLLRGFPDSKAIFRVKHDSSNIYVLIEFLTDKSIDSVDPINKRDVDGFYIDTKHSAPSIANEDTIAVYIRWMTNAIFDCWIEGASQGAWRDIMSDPPSIECASSLSPSPTSKIPHMIYEKKIPKQFLLPGATVPLYDISNRTDVGIYVAVYDQATQTTMIWPSSKFPLRNLPANWGDLYFEVVPIPEFPSAVLTLVLGIFATILIRRHRNKPQFFS